MQFSNVTSMPEQHPGGDCKTSRNKQVCELVKGGICRVSALYRKDYDVTLRCKVRSSLCDALNLFVIIQDTTNHHTGVSKPSVRVRSMSKRSKEASTLETRDYLGISFRHS